MMEEDFRKVDAELMACCDAVLKQRGSAYATQQDRFANFKEIAQQVGCSPLHVCHIYLLKGMSVINKLMRGENVAGEREEERFADAINYLRLGYAIRQELRKAAEDFEAQKRLSEAATALSARDEARELNEQEAKRCAHRLEELEKEQAKSRVAQRPELAMGQAAPGRPLR